MTEKIISQLDKDGYFSCPVEADESPLEPGVYLIPANAVDFPPPAIPDGKRAKWNGSGFSIEYIPEPPPLDIDRTLDKINTKLQAKLDEIARNWGYMDIVTACSYAASTSKQFAADAAALIQWRDEVWHWAIPKLATVVPGETPEEFMADMPAQPAQPKP